MENLSMPQQYKVDRVKDLAEVFDKTKNYIFNDYQGLTVEKMTALRRELRKLNVKFKVVKNTFARKVIKNKEIPDLGNNLTGPTAVAFVDGDISEVLKVLFKYAKESTLKVKGGWTDSRIFDEKGLEALSKLPGKAQLIAMLMATLNAPMQNFAYACNDVIGRLVRVVKAVGDNKK
jgi:large subunit ribosomal protein L10